MLDLKALYPDTAGKIQYLIDNYKKMGIYISPIKLDKERIIVKVEQKEFINDKILTPNQLIDLGREVFNGKIGGENLITIIPILSNLDEIRSVNASYVKHKLQEFNLKPSQLVNELDLDKSTISQLINNQKEFTKPLRAAFYYYFKVYKLMQISK